MPTNYIPPIYVPPTLQAQIDAIHNDADLECCWAESYEECQQIIDKGQIKILELLNQK